MQKDLRLCLQSALVLWALGIGVQVSAQPEVVTDVPVNSTGFVTIGDLVYFMAGDELWRTDGTAEGTIPLKSGFLEPGFFTEFNGAAYFTNANNSELWKSDGTPSGTIRLHSSENNNLKILGQPNGNLFFQAYGAATGLELYRTDGTSAGTMLVKDINPGSDNGFAFFAAAVGNSLYFAANNGTDGRELWKSDGTFGGTVMVKDINPGAADGFDSNVTVLGDNNLFYFAGNTLESGTEPWVSDGTTEGTYMLQDTHPGAESAGRVDYRIAHEGIVYFLLHVRDMDGSVQLWRSAGTTESTSMIKFVGYDFEYHSFLVYGDKIAFFNFIEPYHDLWVSDGTTEGTQMIFELHADNSADYFDVVNDHMLFAGMDQGYPTAFYRSDGTRPGTEPFVEFKSHDSPSGRRELTTVGDYAFYADHDGPVDEGGFPEDGLDSYHLFQTDGFKTQSIRLLLITPVGVDNITDFNGHVVYTTYDDQGAGTGSEKLLWIYDPASLSETPASLTLVNADTNEDIQTLHEGDTVYLPENLNVNIRFNPAYTPESVRFVLNGGNMRTELEPPYALAGDKNGDYNTWEVGSGSPYVAAWPNYIVNGERVIGAPTDIQFKIIREPVPVECTASGTILREYWGEVRGSRVSDIPLHTAPTSMSQLSSFEGPTNSGTNYGARIKGYICPPATGEYIFWIASNDHSELWLSTDDNPANKVRIAFVEGATTPQQWTKFSSQKSVAISLTAGERYYIEALHKQGAGSDNLAVGWQLPDGSLERPIPGSRLSPAGAVENSVPTVAIENPKEGDTFNSPTNVALYAVAKDSDGSVTKVEFFADSEKLGDGETTSSEDLYKYVWQNVPPGTHTITARATDNSGGTGTSTPVTFSVTGVACAATGFITRDYWANVPGSRVSDIPVNSPPTSTTEINIFEGPSNVGTNYASRIRGYVCPPMTGNYTFWIASNDHSELWLSSVADDPSAKQRIAFVEGATGPQQWTKFSSQRSGPVMLEQGKRYYIEALHKQGVGIDHLAVGWMLPNFSTERPIPGRHLSPFNTNDAARMASGTEATTSDEKALYSGISIYPNPVPTGEAELRISGYEGVDEIIETQVEIINLTGEVVYQERVRCGGDCSTYLMNINQQLVPGVYIVNMKTNGTRFSRRLLVK